MIIFPDLTGLTYDKMIPGGVVRHCVAPAIDRDSIWYVDAEVPYPEPHGPPKLVLAGNTNATVGLSPVEVQGQRAIFDWSEPHHCGIVTTMPIQPGKRWVKIPVIFRADGWTLAAESWWTFHILWD